MSIDSILNSALSGLFTNQTSLGVTANNIANVNTDGYTRLKVATSASVLAGEAVGVQIDSIFRVVDEFLNASFRTSVSASSQYEIQESFHDRIQGQLGDPSSDSSLAGRINKAYSSLADLTLNPSDTLRRTGWIADVDTALQGISDFADTLQTLRGDASQRIEDQVGIVNTLLDRVHSLNPLIAAQNLSGTSNGALEGQMDAALEELSQYISVNVNRQSNGTILVSGATGQILVDKSVYHLDYRPPGTSTAETDYPLVQIFRIDRNTGEAILPGKDFDAAISAGSLRGLLDMRDGQLRDLALTVGELGANMMDQFNAVHNSLTAVPAPNQLIGEQTAISGVSATNFTGIVTFAITDENNNLVAKHTVDFDAALPADFNALIAQVNAGLGGAGTLSLTGGVMSMQSTNPLHGVVISDDEVTPSSRAGRGFSHFFGMNNLIDAKQTGIYENGFVSTDVHNMGATETIAFDVNDKFGRNIMSITVPVAGATFNDMITELNNAAGLGAYFSVALNPDGTLSFTENPAFSGLQLDVVSDSTNVNGTGVSFTELFGIGDQYYMDAAKDIGVSDRITTDIKLLSMSQFDNSAIVGATAIAQGDQSGSLRFQDLESKLFSFRAAGEIPQTNATLSQYITQVIGNSALMANRASNLAQDNGNMMRDIEKRKMDVGGVNMDEELANMIIYQNAYNASARMLTSAQELFDTLLRAV